MEIERRNFVTELRVAKRDGDDKPVIRGHGAVFDSLSENLGGFREKIDPGAFDGVMEDDVRALFNHNADHILGRSSAGTLKIGLDKRGLTYEIDPPDTQIARDLLISIERGDVRESSFGFTVGEDDWEESEDGGFIRTIRAIKGLFDVSPVTYPAYPDTDVAKRELRGIMEARKSAADKAIREAQALHARTLHITGPR